MLAAILNMEKEGSAVGKDRTSKTWEQPRQQTQQSFDTKKTEWAGNQTKLRRRKAHAAHGIE
jgi:hypothetical protein